jgi:hypothetical protein
MVVGLAMMFVAIVTTMQEVTPTDLILLEKTPIVTDLGEGGTHSCCKCVEVHEPQSFISP